MTLPVLGVLNFQGRTSFFMTLLYLPGNSMLRTIRGAMALSTILAILSGFACSRSKDDAKPNAELTVPEIKPGRSAGGKGALTNPENKRP